MQKQDMRDKLRLAILFFIVLNSMLICLLDDDFLQLPFVTANILSFAFVYMLETDLI